MEILIIEPGQHPRKASIEHTLENLQKVVGGYIQAVYPFDDPVAVVCDEEGLFKDCKWNRLIAPHTAIKGTFFICGLSGDNFDSLSPELMEKYRRKFWEPHYFIPSPDGLIPVLPAGYEF